VEEPTGRVAGELDVNNENSKSASLSRVERGSESMLLSGAGSASVAETVAVKSVVKLVWGL
jgi:hypothetical protein